MSMGAIGATVVGGALASKAASKAADAQVAAGQQAAEMAKFDPKNVTGLFGTGAFDPSGESRVALNPETQRMVDQIRGSIGDRFAQGQTRLGSEAEQGALGFMQAGMQSDPYALAQSQFEKMESILNPSRNRQRDALEARLLRQGRLGSTGGALSQQGLESAIEESRQRGLYDALQQGMGVQQHQLGLGQNLGLFAQQQENVGLEQGLARLGALQGIDQQAMQYLNLGGAFGGRAAQAGANAGQFGMQGAGMASMANLGAARGQQTALNQIGSAFNDWQKDAALSAAPYNADTGRGTLGAMTDDQWANNWDY